MHERRAFGCRLTPDRALESLDEAEAFLLDRGLLTRTADSALPSLFGACHEEPYAPSKPGFGQWPRTKYPWFGELGARGYPVLAVHRGKSLLVTPEVGALFDPLCRGARLEAARRATCCCGTWPRRARRSSRTCKSSSDFAPKDLKRMRAPLERCGALVSRSVVYEEPHRHTSLLSRWDQLFPEAAPGGGLDKLVVRAVGAAVLAPEAEVPRWFAWWEDGLVQRLVEDGRLASPEPGWLAAS